MPDYGHTKAVGLSRNNKYMGFTNTTPLSKSIKQQLLANLRVVKRQAIIGLVLTVTGQIILYTLIPLGLSATIALVTSGYTFSSGPALWWLIGGMALAVLIDSTLINSHAFRTYGAARNNLRAHVERDAFNKLTRKDYNFFANERVGGLTSHYIGYVEGHAALMDLVSLELLVLSVSYTVSLIIIGITAPVLLPALLVLTFIVIWHTARALKKRAHLRTARKHETSAMRGDVADSFGNYLLFKVFAREEHERQIANSHSHAIKKMFIKEFDILAHEGSIRIFIVYTFQLATLVSAIYFFQEGYISLVILIFTMTYLIRTANDMFKVGPLIRQFEQALLDISPMAEILAKPDLVQDKSAAPQLAVTRGEIAIHNMSFAYQEESKDTDVFRSLTLKIPGGQRVGLVGPSGGGKTTITKLLLRFTDVQSGDICIDDQNIAEVTQDSLRSHISYVPQEPFLFHRTVRDNIAYGKLDATDAEIISAATKAHAYDFIERLPNGLDTLVGERGVKLSGGQKQRIAIARAILKDAPILVLDEATSALDSESEKLIQSSLNELMKNRTSIVIAHRLSTIAKLDRIIVLDRGKITEDGTHTELLKQNGTYARLWSHQSGGFIED